ncbi:MAG: DUF1156 domain-containing protein [Planctomycetes bacterium]|nr:DUF1156 domain-containing protein [Planctomycetota bacterium]
MPEQACPRLIEVALPIREISAESVRDKNIHHAHISHLHIWWARRPLAACRAIVFASIVPDPDDPGCPADFRSLVLKHLKDDVPQALRGYQRGRKYVKDADPYRPYDGIPDTPRNRLLTFIAKWSPEWLDFEKGKRPKQPPPKEMLDDRSLVKWETSDPENERGRVILGIARDLVRAARGGETPSLLDPFAGGGAIPLEATRLGCRAIANDYNPVAHLILRATCEFPQKYGKRGVRKDDFGRDVQVPNVLAYDVEHWAKWILGRAKQRIGHLYPPGKDGKPVVGYLWARTTPCSNPSCRAGIPLLRSLLVCNRKTSRVALSMNVDRGDKVVSFGIVRGRSIKRTEGTKPERGSAVCPFCDQPTTEGDMRRAGSDGKLGERMVAVICDTSVGKDYRSVEGGDEETYLLAQRAADHVERPSERHADANDAGLRVHNYGFKTFGSLFNPRQLLCMQSLSGALRECSARLHQSLDSPEYAAAVQYYLSLWLGRVAMFSTSVGVWKPSGEFITSPFSMQAIPMVWDYCEANPFSESTGGALSQLDWVLRFLRRESPPPWGGCIPLPSGVGRCWPTASSFGKAGLCRD